MKEIAALFKSISIFEIVFTLVVSVALGIAFWGWTFVYEIAKPLLKVYGLSYLTAGFWIFSSVFVAQVIRKPGIALIASLMAAFAESLLTHWGLMSLLWGLVQGLGAELIFLIFFYKKWGLKTVILASFASAFFSYTLDFFLYGYKNMSLGLNLTQLVSFLLSAALLSGILSDKFTKRLLRLGLLDQFLISSGT